MGPPCGLQPTGTTDVDRRDKILHLVDREGLGLEFGPSHAPLAPKREGFRVQVLDHLDAEGLRRKYKNHPVDLEQIEEVDFVWGGGSYGDLIGDTRCYDWIIASHVIEHTPNLIGFLQECELLLKAGGVLSLAIPDKRYCFDAYRPISGLGRIVDSHVRGDCIHSPGTVCEYFMNVVSRGGRIAWEKGFDGRSEIIHGSEEAIAKRDEVARDGVYLDLHAWCFVPSSFRLLLNDLFELGYLRLREAAFFPSAGSEFYVTLSAKGEGPGCSRLDLLQAVETELKED